MTLRDVSITGTYPEFKKLYNRYNIRYFVRVDLERYLIDIRVPDDFKIGRVSSVRGLLRKLKEHSEREVRNG